MIYDAIVIGGGAAGLFCAITAGCRGRRVLVLEHNAEVGRKIIISGGGRCNFTNHRVDAENFVSENPQFAISALSRFTPQKFVDLVVKHKIDFYQKKLGQLFCRGSSRQIVDMLVSECRRARVEIRTGSRVSSVVKSDGFEIETHDGLLRAKSIVVACGGLSFPKICATDFGYAVARQFGLKIVNTRPSLVGLVFEGERLAHLAGVTLDASVTAGKHTFRENVLFTHRGLSGPAILQISNYWNRSDSIAIDLLPGQDAARLLGKGSRRSVANYLGQLMPQRVAAGLVARQFPDKPVSQLTREDIEMIGSAINGWEVKFRETEGYDRAEVTLGGVSTAELSSQTMEARRVPGLYFIGEVVDVTGWLGGYNFQWAWSSGFAAGEAL